MGKRVGDCELPNMFVMYLERMLFIRNESTFSELSIGEWSFTWFVSIK